MQYEIQPSDLALVLALVRGGTLASAGAQLSMDASTVFRQLQKLERGLGQVLFDRSRQGYAPQDLALRLASQAEHIEAAIEMARAEAQEHNPAVSGSVRITTTDVLLHGLLLPALGELRQKHPLLQFDLNASHELASLTKRDADLALRATKRPPAHLVGRKLGVIKVAVYVCRTATFPQLDVTALDQVAWIAPDEAMPEHPSVVWRKKHFPKVTPQYCVNSILSVMEGVSMGLGVGVLPIFLAQSRPELRPMTPALADAQTDLWLLTHPDVRHLLRIKTVYSYLLEHLQLPAETPESEPGIAEDQSLKVPTTPDKRVP